MKGIWVLLLLMLAAALPAIIAFFWFRSKKSAITLPWFLSSLVAGIISFIVAAAIQVLFAPRILFYPFKGEGLWPLFVSHFIRIALVEEASRVIVLFLFNKAVVNRRVAVNRQAAGNRLNNTAERAAGAAFSTAAAFSAAVGLTAGLGFAVIESAFHGISNINIALLRIFNAVPLHAACGIRAGAAVFIAPQRPARAFFMFVFSVLIHGTYNLMIDSPAIPSFLAIPAALIAFFASIHYLSDNCSSDAGN
jgi:RsiW-degrading membrane proteinase PrsW (M82 family)